MSNLRLFFLVVCLAAGMAVGIGPSASADQEDGSCYLSRGDSSAVGAQANPVDGSNVITDEGYPDQLARRLGSEDHSPTHVELGCPGENTATMISGGICPYPRGNQIAAAMAFLRAHRWHVR